MDGDQRVTYEDLARRSLALAAALGDKGIRRGDRIAIGMRNSAEHVVAFFAIQYVGAVAVPFNFRLKPPGIAAILRLAEARMALVDNSSSAVSVSDHDSERRARCRLPEGERHRPKWAQAIEMLDELAGWGLRPAVIVADAGYGEITEFRQALEQRQLPYVVQVKSATSVLGVDAEPVLAAWKGRGRPPVARYDQRRSSLRELALAAGEGALSEIVWREGSRGELRSRFLALRVRPANVKLRRVAANNATELPVAWMLAEWPPGAQEPTKYWLADLPADTPLPQLVALAKIRWRIEHDYRELKDALGLDHFEGRSYPGWHHHVTIVTIAHAFLTLERTRRPQTRAAA